MTKRKTLRERAWESALNIWPGLRGSLWMRPNAEGIWLAGYRAAKRDVKPELKRADTLQSAIERSLKEDDGHEWLRAWMQGDVE